MEKNLKLIHFSDTHLGFSDLDILNDKNINQREADFYDAFSQVVEQIRVAQPDYIIHTGDLFHRSSPSNRAITFALEALQTIDSFNIPFIIIAGNHSTPRTNLSSPIMKIFDNFKNIYSSYEQEYKKIEFDDTIFHTLPHINDESKALEQIELCQTQIDRDKKNIMMLHCSVGAHFMMQEFGEWVYPKEKESLFEQMDYVALGHWHGFGRVGKHPNVFYSGSTERTSLSDKRNSKGYVEISLEESASCVEKLQVEYKEITIRPIITKEIDALEYERSLETLEVADTKDAIVDVKLINLTPLQSIDIQNREIIQLFSEAMSVTIKREFLSSTNEAHREDIESLTLQEYFLEHIKEDASQEEYKRLKSKIDKLFSEYEESYNDSH